MVHVTAWVAPIVHSVPLCGAVMCRGPHTAPLSGTLWTMGATQAVTWTTSYTTPGCTTVSVLFSSDGGATYPRVLQTLVSVGSLMCPVTVPNLATLTARIKLVSEQGQGLFDESGIFTVA